MRRVLVTGAGGLLGGWVVHALAHRGAPSVSWPGFAAALRDLLADFRA